MDINVFDNIFKGLIFYKVSRQSPDNYTMYVAQLQSFTANAKRYVILFVLDDYAFHQKAYINQLRWTSLQTRTIPDDYGLPEQNMDPKSLDSRYHQKIHLSLKDRNQKQTEYYSQLPIEIAILHDPKRKSIYQYPDDISLRQALATFQCVIKRL